MNNPNSSPSGRQCGNGASGRGAAEIYLDGFKHGERDVLRRLCREVDDPEVWCAAHHLTAGGDAR
jgi:hypothetical protein